MGYPSPFLLSQPGESIELQDIFVYFAETFGPLSVPKSIAEGRISEDDIGGLTDWFSALYGKPKNWCDRNWQEPLIGGQTAPSREMVGALFLIMCSELCRDQCGEDSVWPKISQVLKADRISFPFLFVGGQPTQACKAAMAAGARRLNLRNLIDRYGTQEYFDTLKLQFGFTLQGAMHRLPEWLDGLGSPIAVNILRGIEEEYIDLESRSFKQLWTAMHEFRKGRITEYSAANILQSSPWVRSSWIPGILLQLNRPSSRSEGTYSVASSDRNLTDSIGELLFRWDLPSKPRLFIHLNEDRVQELLSDADIGVFAVDGRVVARWTAQSGGAWSGPRTIACEPDIAKNKPNLRPKLLFITTGEGKSVAEVNLQEMGSNDPLMLFDLKTGSIVNLGSTLDTAKQYALLCDSEFDVPESDKFVSLAQCTVYQLKCPLSRNLKVNSQGAIYWQPTTSEIQPRPSIRLRLSSAEDRAIAIEGETHIVLDGLPDDTESATLTIGRASYDFLKRGAKWQTQTPVPITLKFVLGEERIRVRFSRSGPSQTVSPQLDIKLSGIATLETDSTNDSESRWNLLKHNRPLNLGEAANRARIFVPFANPELYEGNRFVGKVTSRTLPFRDLFGWGSSLVVRSPGETDLRMVERVEDRGCVALYLPILLGKPIHRLYLQKPIQPSRNHTILAWRSLDTKPITLGGELIEYERDGFVWKIPDWGQVTSLAVSYNGTWLGSFTNASLAVRSLQRNPSAYVFALTRWLKLPVLSNALRSHFHQAVLRDPFQFVTGWLHSHHLGSDLVFREPDPGADAILRWFLWDHIDQRVDRLDKIARSLPGDHQGNDLGAFASSLVTLSELCPALAYNFAKAKVRGEKHLQCLRSVVAQILRHPPATALPLLLNSKKGLNQQCAALLRVEAHLLEKALEDFGSHLDHHASSYRQFEPVLRQMGELSLGRQQLAASLLLRILEGRAS